MAYKAGRAGWTAAECAPRAVLPSMPMVSPGF